MKKIIAFTLALVLVLSLSACTISFGNKPANSGGDSAGGNTPTASSNTGGGDGGQNNSTPAATNSNGSDGGNSVTPSGGADGNTGEVNNTGNWPDNWPGDIPKMDGAVDHYKGTDMNKGGFTVYMNANRDDFNNYVDMMKSNGYTATDITADPGSDVVTTKLTNDKYTITVGSSFNDRTCTLIVVLK